LIETFLSEQCIEFGANWFNDPRTEAASAKQMSLIVSGNRSPYQISRLRCGVAQQGEQLARVSSAQKREVWLRDGAFILRRLRGNVYERIYRKARLNSALNLETIEQTY